MNTSQANPAMPNGNTCPQCGAALPVDALAGLCPACLLKQGAAADTAPPPGAAPFTPPSVADLAKLFPQLEIISLVGQGGMGAVYKARQKHLDRIVALKILPPAVSHDPKFAERFTREARALAKLNHPNIVTLYEFGQADGLFYFLMEFMDGMNLRQLLSAGRVTPKEALAIVPPICDALQFAHDRGIVHRDIKPENILLSKGGQVKIADFGVAKIVASEPATTAAGGADAPLPAQTDGGLVMGTPQYMAPEQTEHPSEVDHRADIYSLGVVFYQMLTGELPKGKFEPPSKKVVIDVRLDEVVLRALEKEPSRRYQQVSEVKTQVETIATTPPMVDVPASASPQPPEGGTPTPATPAAPKSGMVRVIELFFGMTFTSPLAIKLINISALGFLGFLSGLANMPFPGWQRCSGFAGFFGFFGFIGFGFIIEMAARGKRGDPSARRFIVVGRRGGKAVVNWPGVLLSFVLMLAILEVATIVASLVLEERVNTNAMLVTFFFALMITGIRIRRGQTMPVDQLLSLDTPAVGFPASGKLDQRAANPLPVLQFWQALEDEDYARAWERTAPYFQRDIGKDEWVARMEKNRRPLGKAVRREQFPFCWLNVGIRHETRCKTTFGSERTAMETVVAALQPNGEWRIESYRLDLIDAVPATPPEPLAVGVPASTVPGPRTPQGETPTGAAAQPAVATDEVRRRFQWPDVLLFCGTLGLAVLGVNLAIALMLWLLTDEPWPMFQPRELPWVFVLMAACAVMRRAALKLGASDAARPAAAPAAKASTAKKIIGALLAMAMAAVMAAGVTVLTWAWTRTISATALAGSYSVADMARIAVWICIAVAVGWFILQHVWRAQGKPRLSLVVQREGQRVIHWPVVRIALLRIGVILAVLWFVQAGASIIAVLTLLLLLKLAISLIRGWTMPLDQLSGWRPEAVASAQHRGFKLFWGILVGVAVALAVRAWVVAPYYAASDVVAPEIPQQSYVLVHKLARSYLPGDIVVYQAGNKMMLGRVAQAGPVNGALQIERRNVSPQSVLISSVVGKVIFNTRAAAPPPAPPRVPTTTNAFPTISSVVVHHRRVVIEGCGSTGTRFVIGVGKGHLSCFLKDSPFTATIERPMWGRGINCTIKDPRGNVLFTVGGSSVGPMTEQQGRIVFREGTLASEPDGSYVIGEFRPDSGLPLPITVRVEKPSTTKILANAKLDVLRVQLRQAREALLLAEARFKTGTLAFPEFQAAKDKVELLEAEITGDPVHVARVRLAVAERQLQYAEALFKGGIMAAPDYQAAKNAVELRQAELRVAEVEASQTGMPGTIPASAASSQTNSPPAIIAGSYDFRKSDAYRKLSAGERERLEQVTRDFMLLRTSLERFADEHNDQLPDTLDQLVPQYFSELPADPFATAKTAQEGAAGYQKSKDGWGYRYRKGVAGNRAWIVASAGLPNFPYLAEKDNVGLYLCKGIWLSGKNLVSVKVGQKPIAQDAPSRTTTAPRLQFRLVADANDTAPTDTLTDPGSSETLRVRREILLDESAVAGASLTNSPEGQRQINILLTETGAKRFGEITAANIRRRLAIVFDGKLLTAPVILSAITGKEMMYLLGNNVSEAEAKRIIQVLPPRPVPPDPFGPVIERTVNEPGENSLIDLDTGRMFTPLRDAFVNDPKSAMEWAKQNGIDAGCCTQDRGLIGFDMVAIPISNESWDPSDFRISQEALSLGKPGNPVYLSVTGKLPSTWLFKTREGGMGVLQITGFTDNPHGVKIRYKLVQTTQHPSAKNAAAAAPAKPAPRLQFRLVADAGDTAPADTLADPGSKEPLRLRREVLLDETAIASATMTNAPTSGGFEITVTFTEAGAKRFSEITGTNIGKRLAMIFDGKVLSAPTIKSVIRDKAVITRNLSAAEADAIVKTLTRTQEASGSSKPLILDADMAQDVVKDIRPDGTIRSKTTITQRNATGKPLRTIQFSASDFIQVDRLSDGQGRTIPFTVKRVGTSTLRYEATLTEPVKPGAEYSYTMEGAEAGLVKPLPQPGEFEYTMRHWPGTIRTRRTERHLLPPGARLLSKEPRELAGHTVNDRIELSINRLIPSGGNLEISYSYVLPTNKKPGQPATKQNQ